MHVICSITKGIRLPVLESFILIIDPALAVTTHFHKNAAFAVSENFLKFQTVNLSSFENTCGYCWFGL